jgi:hypothetical protein
MVFCCEVSRLWKKHTDHGSAIPRRDENCGNRRSGYRRHLPVVRRIRGLSTSTSSTFSGQIKDALILGNACNLPSRHCIIVLTVRRRCARSQMIASGNAPKISMLNVPYNESSVTKASAVIAIRKRIPITTAHRDGRWNVQPPHAGQRQALVLITRSHSRHGTKVTASSSLFAASSIAQEPLWESCS